MTVFDLGSLPLYNQDMDNEKAPTAVHNWKKKVEEADAIIFACPEHNYSMTAATGTRLASGIREKAKIRENCPKL